MMDFVEEIREQRAQGATETEILLTFISAYDKEEIDFDELMERVNALNSEFNTQYDVSPLDDDSSEKDEVSLDEEAKADELFGMTATDNNENEKKEQSTMEDEE